ncbi:MAG: hypothetical protein J7M21_06050 [Planctomycetes bacterium]|nr:hypothetical protein [Planctomycetota bacterium]
MRRFALWAAVTAAALGAGPAAPADEMDDLAAKLHVRPAFLNYRPEFHYTQRTIELPTPKGTERRVFRFIMDGEKYVALISEDYIELLAFTPARARRQFALRSGRYHLDNVRGPLMPTGAFLGRARGRRPAGRYPSVPQTDHFRGGGLKVTLVRARDASDRKVVDRYDFLVHPVFGYMVDAHTEVTFKRPPSVRQFTTTVFCPNSYIPWPTRQIYDMTVFCPGQGGGYRCYVNNPLSIARAGRNSKVFTWRDGGFIAFLSSKTAPGVCRTRSDGGPPAAMTLDARNQFHVTIPLPDRVLGTASQDQPYVRQTYRAEQRLFGLPPAIAEYLRKHATAIPVGTDGVICRIGQTEDFEDQPVALSEPVQGLAWTAGSPLVTLRAAHSGRKSLELRGQWRTNEPVLKFRPDRPPVPLRPEARYRLEAYLRAESMSDEQRESYRRNYLLLAARLRGQGRQVPPFVAPKRRGEAYIIAELHERYPRDPNVAPVAVYKTKPCLAATDGAGTWQKVSLEFTTPRWDPFVEFVFVVDSGQALLDDFTFRRVD